MITVYTIVDKKLAQWTVDTTDVDEAIATVRETLPSNHSHAILASIK